MESRDELVYLCSLISTAQEQFPSGAQNPERPDRLFTALPGDDAVEAPTDSLTNKLGVQELALANKPASWLTPNILKEKIEYVKRAYWKEDWHDPDLR
jgi:hypothetical protein